MIAFNKQQLLFGKLWNCTEIYSYCISSLKKLHYVCLCTTPWEN